MREYERKRRRMPVASISSGSPRASDDARTNETFSSCCRGYNLCNVEIEGQGHVKIVRLCGQTRRVAGTRQVAGTRAAAGTRAVGQRQGRGGRHGRGGGTDEGDTEGGGRRAAARTRRRHG